MQEETDRYVRLDIQHDNVFLAENAVPGNLGPDFGDPGRFDQDVQTLKLGQDQGVFSDHIFADA